MKGDFHSDIAGCRIRFRNPGPGGAPEYLKGFSLMQKGAVGDITAGFPPQPYVQHGYIEFYSESNGRVVLELEPGCIEVVSVSAWRPAEQERFDAKQQESAQSRLSEFLEELAEKTGCEAMAVSCDVVETSDEAE